MITRAFFDSSVLVDAFHPGHAEHHLRATRLLNQVQANEIELHTSATVLFETAFVLERRYSVPRKLLVPSFRSLVGMSSVVIPDLPITLRTIDLWEKESPLSFADCYHLVLAESLDLDGVYAFDHKMGRYKPVQRLEP